MLSNYSDLSVLKNIITDKMGIPSLPKIYQRDVWETLDETVKQQFIEHAETYLNYQWTVLTATQYMDFTRTGSREQYDLHERTTALGYLSIAECIENKGRFVDEIINFVWMLCEITTWVPPAHNHMDQNGLILADQELPIVTKPFIDLFASEVGAMLSIVYYLLKDVLDQVTPIVGQRIGYEVNRRIIVPFMENDDFWWMGFNEGVRLNNWTPWVVSNCMVAFMIFEENYDTKVKGLAKGIKSIQQFLKDYPKDGGCDEGPTYWCQAGGTLFECLELLYLVSEGNLDVFHEPLIKNIGSYIYKAHIHEGYYMNFADSGPIVNVAPDLMYRFGLRTKDEHLIKSARAEFTRNKGNIIVNSWFSMLKTLNAILNHKTIQKLPNSDYPLLKAVYLQELQVMTAREQADSSNGLYLAVKGGHNSESHNHNDVGNFIIYKDGQPAIIDVGVGVYTRKTFGPDRYEIWTMQSQFHNLPNINSYMQKNGPAFKAKNVTYITDEVKSELTLDLTDAYPKETGMNKFVRMVKLEHNNDYSVQLKDLFEMQQPSDDIHYHFMTCCECELVAPGRLKLLTKDGDVLLDMFYQALLLDIVIEEIKLTDQKLLESWGTTIYRIHLKTKHEVQKEEIIIQFI